MCGSEHSLCGSVALVQTELKETQRERKIDRAVVVMEGKTDIEIQQRIEMLLHKAF